MALYQIYDIFIKSVECNKKDRLFFLDFSDKEKQIKNNAIFTLIWKTHRNTTKTVMLRINAPLQKGRFFETWHKEVAKV